MSDSRVRRVVIVGGGTAGWMSAALLARALGDQVRIELVESDAIASVGVGEATIPQIQHVNAFLGLNEHDMLRAVRGTYKLAIQFNGWGAAGDSYLHAFGDIGLPLGLIPFQHYWLRSRQQAHAPDLWAYSLNAQACQKDRFAPVAQISGSPLTGTRHAYHLDAGLYARYLRTHCPEGVVRRTEGRVVDVALREDGFIDAVLLDDGTRIEGDLFIDCSGFRGLLIEQALGAGYESWQHWLPCDRAVVVPSERSTVMRPYTQASARAAGWQWRIPLQHRTGNGHVYCSRHMSDDEAAAVLLEYVEGQALDDPRLLRFHTGMRRRFWVGNCVALGLSSGFMEPLESTGIHLIQSGISRLLAMFPDRHCDAALRDAYNRQTRFEYERIRDFLILHYRANRRDEPFWRQCTRIELPDSLRHKLDVFARSGQIFREGEELFTEVGWLQVLVGQGQLPVRYHPLADSLDAAKLDEFLSHIRTLVGRGVAQMPTHADYLARHCGAAA
ncbi:tryptophan halogenase family protein [Oleiagrimonas sp. C23AA]|uniref:tryptophan halogenase family protein n=1 Tax=Oleiagrimonas sp. C23AA TaxID=2719047 RepID=UPI00141EBCB6|nr:tryptophan halogenase family protein [Oleiagrimonas sp. C23AA]NII11217.1 tryptophan 7-halogenase [Oleiagrimonas sp. C23AA]